MHCSTLSIITITMHIVNYYNYYAHCQLWELLYTLSFITITMHIVNYYNYYALQHIVNYYNYYAHCQYYNYYAYFQYYNYYAYCQLLQLLWTLSIITITIQIVKNQNCQTWNVKNAVNVSNIVEASFCHGLML